MGIILLFLLDSKEKKLILSKLQEMIGTCLVYIIIQHHNHTTFSAVFFFDFL